MSKGSSPAGSTTVTTTNPAEQAQLPFLSDIWNKAQYIYNNNPVNPYPGQTLANFIPTNPLLTQGYNSLNTAGQNLAGTLQPVANSAFTNLAGSDYKNSPAYGGYNAYATGTTPAQQTIDAITGKALTAGQQYPAAISQYAPATAGYGAQAAGPNVGTNALAAAAQGQGPGLNALLASNPGLDQLNRAASGAYLNSNPYMDAMFKAASNPVASTYQTVTAPTTDAQFSGGGRYGSGAYAGGVSSNEQNLGRALSDLSANLYGNQYAKERSLQDAAAASAAQLTQSGAKSYQDLVNQAATNYGTLTNQGLQTAISGQTAAGDLQNAAANQAYAGLGAASKSAAEQALAQQYGISGLQGAYNAGNQTRLSALNAFPQLATASLLAPNAQITAGKGLTDIDQTYRTYQQQQFDDLAKRYNALSMQPWTNLNLYGQAVGNPLSGSSSVTSPYFQNPLANALGTVSGGLGLAKNLGGLSGLFGGGGGAGAAGVFDSAGNLLGPGLASIPEATLDAAAAAGGIGGGGGTALALAGLPFGTIICTELLRQGKMPKRHYAAGLRVWQAYPDRIKRGYYVWAIPTVRHLRAHPNSLFSRAMGAVCRWRAEDVAARAGVRSARRSCRGRAVTLAFYGVCSVLGCFVPMRDLTEVYQEAARG